MSTEILDLNFWPSAQNAERCDVCVIGAGAAGIYVGTGLAARGFDVVLLEAGGREAAAGSTLIGSDAVFAGDVYPAATAGRYFGIGGTTSQWGGYLIPHSRHDVRPTVEPFDPWSHVVRTVSDRRAEVLTALGWTAADGFTHAATERATAGGKALEAAGFDVVSGLMLPNTRKNFACLLNDTVRVSSRVRLYANAVVTSLQPSPGTARSIERVRATSPSGKSLDVTASRFVVAAGAIESARILLELDRAAGRPILRSSAATGRYLADHLSVPIGSVTPQTRRDAIELFAPRFEHGWMRSFRFIEAHPPAHAPRAFAHFTFDTQSPGFTATKEVLRAFQARRRPRVNATDLVAGFGDIAKLGFHRYARQRLYVRLDTEVQLQLDVEQQPLRENRITLGAPLDRFGRHVAEVHWRIGEQDVERITETAQRFMTTWPRQGGVPVLQPLTRATDALKPYDAYHPVGTCRLGRDPEAVVDEDLKVWGVDNLWVLSTGVLPSAGTANPTFTMLCLGEQLVRHLGSSSRAVDTQPSEVVHA